MCGIFGVVNDINNQAANTVLEGLKKLEYRGYDSWGIALKSTVIDSLMVEKRIGKIGEAKTRLPSGRVALGHTRWATHGGVTNENAHPHLDCQKKFAVIHNGIVENYLELKTKLVNLGHNFISQTDTEVIAHLIEEYGKNNNHIKAVFMAFGDLIGSNAIAVLDYKNSQIVACRDGSPLVVGKGNNEFFLASDVPAFLKFTNLVYYLNDREGVILNDKGIYLYSLKNNKKVDIDYKTIDWKQEDIEKNQYPHFLLKEIMEQPRVLVKTSQTNESAIIKLANLIKKKKNIVITGCGTAFYCALLSRNFFADENKKIDAFPAYELSSYLHFYNNLDLFIAVSQSGETADTIGAAKKAKERGMVIVAIVNTKGSTLERLADITIPVGAGPEIAVVSTKAFTAQLTILFLIAKAINKKYEKGSKQISILAKKLDKWLNDKLNNKIARLAAKLFNQQDMFIIGKHYNYPSALEFALKIKEASYIHSEAFASGELKHGVIALIQKNTPCFVLLNNDSVKHEVLSSAIELKARGAFIIGVSPINSQEFDYYIKTPEVNELTVFANIIVGQLLGYYLGVAKGTDPDKPRNLAKSVTVK